MSDLNWFKAISEMVLQLGALGILGVYFLKVQPQLLREWMQVADRNTHALMELNTTVGRVEESQKHRDQIMEDLESVVSKLAERTK